MSRTVDTIVKTLFSRCSRILILTDITEGERRKSERVVNAHRKAAKDAELYARSLLVKIEQQRVSDLMTRAKE